MAVKAKSKTTTKRDGMPARRSARVVSPAHPLSKLTLRIASSHGGYGWTRDLPDARDFLYAAPLIRFPKVCRRRSTCGRIVRRCTIRVSSAVVRATALRRAIQFDEMKQIAADVHPFAAFHLLQRARHRKHPRAGRGAQIRDGIKAGRPRSARRRKRNGLDVIRNSRRNRRILPSDAKSDLVTAYARAPRPSTSCRVRLADGYPFVFGFTVYESFEATASPIPASCRCRRPRKCRGRPLRGGRRL